MPREHDESNVARMPGATAVEGVGSSSHDARVKSDEAALRRVANTGGVGAFAVAQAAPGGRRQGPRVRRSASARRRARQRAGLEPVDGDGGEGGGGEPSGMFMFYTLSCFDGIIDHIVWQRPCIYLYINSSVLPEPVTLYYGIML